MNQKIRVMVAEDLDVLRDHYCSIIQSDSELQLTGVAVNGREIIRLAEQDPPDVILMDIEMDNKTDGIQAAKIITKANPLIHILFLSVHEDDETIFDAFATGAVNYILKNAPTVDILHCIKDDYRGITATTPKIASKIMREFSRISQRQATFVEVITLVSQLTVSEAEILLLLLNNCKPTDIAQLRHVEPTTVKSQINSILKKFQKKRSKEVVQLLKDLKMEEVIASIHHPQSEIQRK